MNSPEDRAIEVLLQAHWQAPAASPAAVAQVLAHAQAAPRHAPGRWRWALPGAAIAAALVLGLWVALPGLQAPVAPGTADGAHLTDEDMASYVFATYELEEIS